jgi:hypothetical protein
MKGKKTIAGASVMGMAGIFAWLYSNFTPMARTEALEDRTTKIENRQDLTDLKLTLDKANEELYFLRSQVRKYPDDMEAKDQLNRVKKHIESLERRILKNGTQSKKETE